jgi:hypothetical protein
MRQVGILRKLRNNFLSDKLIKLETSKPTADIDEVVPILAILTLGIGLSVIVLAIEIATKLKRHVNQVGREKARAAQ